VVERHRIVQSRKGQDPWVVEHRGRFHLVAARSQLTYNPFAREDAIAAHDYRLGNLRRIGSDLVQAGVKL
jgi:hypothetical protein